MSNAINYPVTTPFGQVPGYPLNNGFHNGIDYGYPSGTPVVVNGVQIARSNNTGDTTGPHLHIGKFVNGVVQNPGIGNGLTFNSAVIYDTGYDDVNGYYVRITADGALWNYLHLQKGSISVIKGQVLKGDDMAKPTHEQVLEFFQEFGLGPLSSQQQEAYVGEDIANLYLDGAKFLRDRVNEAETAAAAKQAEENQYIAGVKQLQAIIASEGDAPAKLEQIRKIIDQGQ